MTTKPRPWPNNAEAARLDALAALDQIIATARPLRDRHDQMHAVEIVRRAGQIIESAQRAQQTLKEVK